MPLCSAARQAWQSVLYSVQSCYTGMSHIKYDEETLQEFAELQDLAEDQTLLVRPTSLQAVVDKTKFDAGEVKIIYRSFKQYCPSGIVAKSNFVDIFNQLFPYGDTEGYANYVFRTFDTDNNGYINFEEFIVGLSVITRGTVREKLSWTWQLYDVEQRGNVTWTQLYNMMSAVMAMMGDHAQPPVYDGEIRAHTNDVFLKLDKDGDGVISEADFVTACLSDPTAVASLYAFETAMRKRAHNS